jgi:hypothetical protein
LSKTCEQEHHPNGCGCEGGGMQGEEPTTCSGGITIPTIEEQLILARIREVQEEAHRLKKAIVALEKAPERSPAELNGLRDQLQALRQQRTALEDQRARAAEERMRLLGHA